MPGSLSFVSLAFLLSVSLCLYVSAVILYRAFFHPLRNVPGPFFARITYLFIFKHNYLSDGSHFYLEIERLHEQYGPVVRIAPNEVHLADPEHHHVINKVGSKFTKDPLFYQNSFGSSLSAFATESNELHRVRRAVLSPLFTRARVLELEPIVQAKVSKLCDLVSSNLKASRPTDLSHAVHSVSVDVITDYAFNQCYNLLDTPDLGASFFQNRKKSQPRLWINQQFPFMQRIANMPRWVAVIVAPPIAKFIERKQVIVQQIQKIDDQMRAGEKLPENKRTIFHQLLDPNAAEDYVVPPIPTMTENAFVIVAAASETVGFTLTQAFWRCLSDAAVHRRLMQELEEHFPDPSAQLGFADLEKLPYLTACLKESLRLAFAIPGRIPRVVPAGGVTFDDQFLPAGTSVSMSMWMSHRNEAYFPDPMKFDPGRWLGGKAEYAPDKVFAPFSRGSRVCLGMTLAWSELYVTLGTVMRRFGDMMEVEDGIGEKDFYPIDDYISGWQREEARVLSVVGKSA